MTWVTARLGAATAPGGVTVIDPDGVAEHHMLAERGEVFECPGWFELRRAYEHHVRGKPTAATILWVRDHDVRRAEDLPWDIGRACSAAVLSWPVGEPWRDLLRQVDDQTAARLIAAVRQAAPGQERRAVLGDLFGVTLPGPTAASELDAVARLRTDPSVPAALWPHVQAAVTTPLAAALAAEPPDLAAVGSAWADWLTHGTDSPWDGTFKAAQAAVSLLAVEGLLHKAPATAAGLPGWVSIGAADPDPAMLVTELLDHRPDPWPPASAADWCATAAWWGEVRSLLATGGPGTASVATTVWEAWGELDAAFGPWLRRELGGVMSRQGALPLTVHQIAPFLARRWRRDGTPLLLIVIDGMAFAQFAQLRRACAFDVVEASACFAMCPTLTSVSRQAIFAGTWPAEFADTLWVTSHESRRWTAFWAAEGLTAGDVAWCHVDGRTASDAPTFGSVKIAGIVVIAVDELLHGADVLGDAQVASGVALWARYGFLDALIRRGHDEGRHVWVTADHGNIEALPTGRVVERLKVEQAGTRARVYESAALRNAARAEGIAWDPPGLPPPGKAMLFAPGRGGYHSGGPRVTHGGLSLDEVIVPFVRVVPR